jgi:hypothetical protein
VTTNGCEGCVRQRWPKASYGRASGAEQTRAPLLIREDTPLQPIASNEVGPKQHQPLTTPTGRSLATLAASPAFSHTKATSSTSL